MKIDKRNIIANKKILFIVPVIASLLIGYISYSYFKGQSSNDAGKSVDSSESQNSTPQETEQETDAKNKQDFLDAQKNNEENPLPSQGGTVSEQRISINVQDEQNGTVTIFTKLTNISSGTCTLTIKSGNSQKSYTADVMYQSDYSSCAGFNVNKIDIGSGTWAVKLEVEVDGNRYSQEITANIT